jgi:hypothetical protein
MATVRFSKELIDRIEKNAHATMSVAVERAKEQKLDNSWGERIYNTLFGDLKPFIDSAPVGWLRHMDRIEIGDVGQQHCGMTFTFTSPQPWPARFIESELARKQFSFGDSIDLKNHLIWGEFHAEVTAYHERVRTATVRREEFVKMVKEVCGTYSTLAPALKAWPPLWDLIPEDVKDKHREIKERTKNEVVLSVDIGKLTALSTAAKFGI